MYSFFSLSLSLSLSLAIFSPFFTFIFFPHLFAGLANEAWCTRVGRIGRRGRESVYLRVEHTTVHYNRAWRNSLWLTSTEIRSSLIFLSLFLVAVSLVFFCESFQVDDELVGSALPSPMSVHQLPWWRLRKVTIYHNDDCMKTAVDLFRQVSATEFNSLFTPFPARNLLGTLLNEM